MTDPDQKAEEGDRKPPQYHATMTMTGHEKPAFGQKTSYSLLNCSYYCILQGADKTRKHDGQSYFELAETDAIKLLLK